ncbi:DUF1392 domain-containing protein [Anabaena subtropica FACHB-260]|uniref:DUF1392 domain-containing protein n=2 Tax=Anabaena TaxID=1163 RepID=A0ABR8CPK4_9NOST|nr:DUF1392 domain-containing protein [Anabaena subtropica FACHB-260]
MMNQINALESCWHISPPWGQDIPALAVQILEKVFLPSANLSGYCCGIHWEEQEWVYAIVCFGETFYVRSGEFSPTNVLKNTNISTPAFKLGDVVEVDFSEQPNQRIIQGIFSLKNSWLYAVEWRSPILTETTSAQSRLIWLADIDLVRVKVS